MHLFRAQPARLAWKETRMQFDFQAADFPWDWRISIQCLLRTKYIASLFLFFFHYLSSHGFLLVQFWTTPDNSRQSFHWCTVIATTHLMTFSPCGHKCCVSLNSTTTQTPSFVLQIPPHISASRTFCLSCQTKIRPENMQEISIFFYSNQRSCKFYSSFLPCRLLYLFEEKTVALQFLEKTARSWTVIDVLLCSLVSSPRVIWFQVFNEGCRRVEIVQVYNGFVAEYLNYREFHQYSISNFDL